MDTQRLWRDLWLGCALTFGIVSPSQASLLGTYQFTSGESEIPTAITGMTFGPFTRNNVVASTTAGVFKSSGWYDVGTSINTSVYVEFVLSPNSGYQLVLTNVTFDWQDSGSGPRSGQMRVFRASSKPADDATPASTSGEFPYGQGSSGTKNLAVTNVTTSPGGSENVYVRIYGYDASSSGSGGTLSFDNVVVTGTVLLPTVVQFAATSASGLEALSPAVLNVTLYPPATGTVTANYATTGGTATNGVDYTLAPGVLTFNAGETNKTISIPIINDGLAENDETIIVSLSNPVGGAQLGSNTNFTYTILDSRPAVSFAAASGSGSSTISPVGILVRLSVTSAVPVSAFCAVTDGTAVGGGVDYSFTGGLLTFSPGIQTQSVNLTIVNNTNSLIDKTVVLTLSSPANGRLGSITNFTYTIVPPVPNLSFADSDTVALWLFDETEYPYTSLLDASANEYDLSLMEGAHLVAGKFGRALSVAPSTNYNVAYAGFSGAAVADNMRGTDGFPSGLWGPTVAPAGVLSTMLSNAWTCEFWLEMSAAPASEASVIDLGNAYDPGVAVNLAAGAASFTVSNSYAGYKAVCPTVSGLLADGQWHHVIFTHTAGNGEIRHYLDGQLQGAPTVTAIPTVVVPAVNWPTDLSTETYGMSASTALDARRQNRFNIALGQNRQGNLALTTLIDEVRLSKVVRYTNNFTPPKTLSRNYALGAPGPAVADGLPLLFAGNPGVLQLGGRKHVFLDTQLFATVQHVTRVMNPPTNPTKLNITVTDNAWRPSVHERNGRIYMFIPDGYSAKEGISRLRYSDDGTNFVTPSWGIVNYNGSTNNDYILYRQPLYGMIFRDLNSRAATDEFFKLTAWSANRGICLFLSPDDIHWRRNETLMLPLVSGGEAETYWDDQRGRYYDFLKRDSSFHNAGCDTGTGRRAVGFQTTEILKTWPFTVRTSPYYESWPFPAVTCEGSEIFPTTAAGEVYRTRAIKYPYAPDTYLAFIWRFPSSEQRKVDLAVSRDGDNWTQFSVDESGPWYVAPLAGNVEALSLYGMVRRGDELWQYVEFGTGTHGDGTRTYWRMTQRLDGFTSLDSGGTTGVLVSKPLVFAGDSLVLNLNATGVTRVGILDSAGNPLPGFAVSDCDPITANSTARTITWHGNSAVSSLAGQTVKLRFEMTNTKLYAIQFVARPRFESASASGGTFSAQGSGGTPGASYCVLTTTNLAQPAANWVALTSNQFDANGRFYFSNTVAPGATRGYYRLQQQ